MYKTYKNIYINRGTLSYNDNTELLGAAHKISSTFAGRSSQDRGAGHSSQVTARRALAW